MNQINAPNIRKALYKFLSKYLTPSVPATSIFWGNQNNLVLPANSQEYVIFYLLSTIRHGTNITAYDSESEEENSDSEYEYIVQVDCYSAVDGTQDGSDAMLRAQSLEILSRSGTATEYLDPMGLQMLYAEDARDTTIISDDNNYLRRWTVTLHLAGHADLTLDSPGFTEIKVVPNLLTTKAQAETQDPKQNRLGIINLDVKFKTNGD